MASSWTFGRKVGVGFAIVVAVTVAISVASVTALRTVVASKDQLLSVETPTLIDAQELAVAAARKVASVRGFLLSREDSHVARMRQQNDEIEANLSQLRAHAAAAEGRRLVDQIDQASSEYQAAAERVVAMRKEETPIETIVRAFESDLAPKHDQLVKVIDAFTAYEQRVVDDGEAASTSTASAVITLVIILSTIAVALASLVAFMLTRTLTRQVGTAVQHVQSSSSELQAAANQQATSAREQATAMNEITTTISELLATSRQIAQSAQRVAQIASETAGGAQAGDLTVQRAHEAVTSIKLQVDLIVTHMLDLGKKSQQIGGVLEIINELADQTNIVAINATIEAVGAGESGKRFAVVADEIRKLADRVAASTKEIRGLIDEIRAAVNTTVMSTESGSKAVDAGARQFADVASSFKHIVGLVGVTTEAVREIELSTKQQTTAVEQVNVAISNVAQTTRETEASSGQTFQTASQLSSLSKDLTRMIRPHVSA